MAAETKDSLHVSRNFFYWSWRPVYIGCFLSLVSIFFIPVWLMTYAATIGVFKERELQVLTGEIAVVCLAIFLSVSLAHTVLYFLSFIKMLDIREYEADPYVRPLYSVICIVLLILYSAGIVGLNMVSSAIPNAIINLIGIFTLSGPCFTGIMVLLINLTAWILRVIFRREIIFNKILMRAKKRSDVSRK